MNYPRLFILNSIYLFWDINTYIAQVVHDANSFIVCLINSLTIKPDSLLAALGSIKQYHF